jgi:hypothetical protein
MKNLLFPAVLALLCGAAWAETDLKCPEFTPKARTVRVLRMQPQRRGKEWLEGSPKTINSLSCDLYGLKTEEAEYDGKNLVLKNSFTYLDKDASKAFCANRKSEERVVTSFSDEGASVDEFCRRYKKKDFTLVQVFDASPSQGRESARKPVRQIFRVFNDKGFPAEEHAFDPTQSLETVTLYDYDKKNNLAGVTVNDMEGRQLRREAFASDKATSSRTHSVFGETSELRKKTIYELREDGTLRREVRSAYDSGEQPVSRAEVYCDAKGRPEKELVYDADAAEPKYEYTYSYKYDNKGNWIEERKTRVIVYNGNRLPDTQYAPEITRREFIYY